MMAAQEYTFEEQVLLAALTDGPKGKEELQRELMVEQEELMHVLVNLVLEGSVRHRKDQRWERVW